MPQGRNKWITLGAVLAVVIVAAPITLIAVEDEPPNIRVVNGTSTYTWLQSFPSPCQPYYIPENVTATSWVYAPGYQNSSLSMLIYAYASNTSGFGFDCFLYNVEVFGNFSSAIRSPGITFYQGDIFNGQIFGGVLGRGFWALGPGFQRDNVSKIPGGTPTESPPEYSTCYNPSLSFMVEFQNKTSLKEGSIFHFALYFNIPFKTRPLPVGARIISFFNASLNFMPTPVHVSAEITGEVIGT